MARVGSRGGIATTCGSDVNSNIILDPNIVGVQVRVQIEGQSPSRALADPLAEACSAGKLPDCAHRPRS